MLTVSPIWASSPAAWTTVVTTSVPLGCEDLPALGGSTVAFNLGAPARMAFGRAGAGSGTAATGDVFALTVGAGFAFAAGGFGLAEALGAALFAAAFLAAGAGLASGPEPRRPSLLGRVADSDASTPASAFEGFAGPSVALALTRAECSGRISPSSRARQRPK